jgi:hypothetical protein
MNAKTLVAGLALAACCGFAQAQNLALNAGFESDTGDPVFAADWIQFGNAIRETAFPRTDAANMTTFGAFTGGFNVSGFFQETDALPGDTVTAKIYTFVSSGDPLVNTAFAVLNIEWKDDFGNTITYLSNTTNNASTPLDTWVQTTTAGVAPPGTKKARLVGLFFQYDNNDTGSVKWDDAELTREAVCVADVNGDGEVDLVDFFDFFNAFDTQCQ